MTGQTSAIRMVTAEALNSRMQENQDFYLIDTLPEDHFRRIRLPGSFNACVFEVTFIDQVEAITRDRDAGIVLYGSSGRSKDALTAAEKLSRAGYRDIGILDGGLDAWRAAGFAVAGEAVDAPDDPNTRLHLTDRIYRVDTDRSIIQWTGRNPSTTHFGTIGLKRGEMTVKSGVLSGTFGIDMNAITNINLEGDALQPVLISHLKSDDFFLTKLFPTATFRIDGAEPAADSFLTIPNCAIRGTLEMRGVKAEQEFMATLTPTAENGLLAEAHFDIDRTRWGIIYGSSRFFEHMGMHVVFDLISFQVRIVASA